jgi:hypothetical protein
VSEIVREQEKGDGEQVRVCKKIQWGEKGKKEIGGCGRSFIGQDREDAGRIEM